MKSRRRSTVICMRQSSVLLALMALAGGSCAGVPDAHVYEAEFSAWAVELKWTHRVERSQFESLELVLKPDRIGEDLAIDGTAVRGTFQHGGADWCARPHRVTGTVRLLENAAAAVRARLDAVMHCPDAEPVTLKGEFAFDVKVPP